MLLKKVALKLPDAYIDGLGLLIKRGLYLDRAEAIRFAVLDLLREEWFPSPRIRIANDQTKHQSSSSS